MSKPRVAILHYSAPPIIGGVESTIGAHAKLFAAHDYPIRIMAGRGASDDSRVEFVRIPEMDSRAPAVEAVNRELDAGRVTPAFSALADRLTRALEDVLADVDVCIAHNAATLHKNLALTTALEQLARRRRVRHRHWRQAVGCVALLRVLCRERQQDYALRWRYPLQGADC
jgi:hypothetical protein